MEAPVPIAILDAPALRYSFVNRAHENLTGKEKLTGKAVFEVFPELTDHGVIQSYRI